MPGPRPTIPRGAPPPPLVRKPGENRTAPRRRLLQPAVIAFAKGLYQFDASIRDVSPGGMRLVVSRHAQLPLNFFVVDIREGKAHEASMVRRTSTELGLSLGKSIPLNGEVDPALAFLKRIWTERASPRN